MNFDICLLDQEYGSIWGVDLWSSCLNFPNSDFVSFSTDNIIITDPLWGNNSCCVIVETCAFKFVSDLFCLQVRDEKVFFSPDRDFLTIGRKNHVERVVRELELSHHFVLILDDYFLFPSNGIKITCWRPCIVNDSFIFNRSGARLNIFNLSFILEVP